MTDKQLEEKKREFYEMFNGSYAEWAAARSLGVEGTPIEVWEWIAQLVEEVEDSLVQEFEDCISEELLMDVEKFLDLKDTVESKWD